MSILRHAIFAIAAALPAAVLSSCNSSKAGSGSDDVLSMERAALDRWGRGDIQGPLEIYADDITYFDPHQEKRVDGLAAMTALYSPLAGKMKIPHYDIIGPKVQRAGDVAVLTYNLVNEVAELPTGPTNLTLHWNVTSVYARVGGQWKIIHSHYSYVKGNVSSEAK